MLRKNIRQRREYLFGLAQEREAQDKSHKLQTILQAQQSNSHLPTELFKEKEQLEEQLKKHDSNTIGNSLLTQLLVPASMMSTLTQSTRIPSFCSPHLGTPPIGFFSSPRNLASSYPTPLASIEEAPSSPNWSNFPSAKGSRSL
jgi:hypothetical protein